MYFHASIVPLNPDIHLHLNKALCCHMMMDHCNLPYSAVAPNSLDLFLHSRCESVSEKVRNSLALDRIRIHLCQYPSQVYMH